MAKGEATGQTGRSHGRDWVRAFVCVFVTSPLQPDWTHRMFNVRHWAGSALG